MKQWQHNNHTVLQQVLTKPGIYGTDSYYVRPGTLLELEVIDPRMPSKFGVVKGPGHRPPVEFRSPKEGQGFLKQMPAAGSMFLVLGHEFTWSWQSNSIRNDVVTLRILWQEEVILATVNVRDYSLRQIFSIKKHSIDS